MSNGRLEEADHLSDSRRSQSRTRSASLNTSPPLRGQLERILTHSWLESWTVNAEFIPQTPDPESALLAPLFYREPYFMRHQDSASPLISKSSHMKQPTPMPLDLHFGDEPASPNFIVIRPERPAPTALYSRPIPVLGVRQRVRNLSHDGLTQISELPRPWPGSSSPGQRPCSPIPLGTAHVLQDCRFLGTSNLPLLDPSHPDSSRARPNPLLTVRF